jgi:hypothetical protein
VNRNDVNWEGPITAIITPFHRDGELDERSLRQHVDSLIANGHFLVKWKSAPRPAWLTIVPDGGAFSKESTKIRVLKPGIGRGSRSR